MPQPADRLAFLTWDGPGADHLTGLFLPILRAVARTHDLDVEVVQGLRAGARLAAAGPDLPGVTHRTAVETATNGRLRAAAAALRLLWQFRRLVATALASRPRWVVSRSVVPGLVVLSLRPVRRRGRHGRAGLRWVHDADGHVAEQRADFAGWRRGGPRHAVTTRIETACARHADVVLVRTPWAARDLARRTGRPAADFVVVPNGRDAERFAPAAPGARDAGRAALGIPSGARVLAYVGSFAPRQRPRHLVALFGEALSRGWHVLCLTPDLERLAELCRTAGVDTGPVHARAVAPDDVPGLLGLADVAVALQVDAPSTRTVAVTKLGEYLLAGLPVIVDRRAHPLVPELLAEGLAIDASSPVSTAMHEAERLLDANATVGDVCRRARARGVTSFSIEAAVAAWSHALDVAGHATPAPTHR